MRNTVSLGISTPELMKSHGLSWVLRRQRITCNRWPKIGDEVSILTAPTGFERNLLTYRDFHLLGPDDEKLISAVSEWLLMDLVSRRLRPIPPHIAALEKSLIPMDLRPTIHLERPHKKLKPPATGTEMREFKVSYGMLDFNDHLTNPVFAELMLEPLGKEFLTGHLPTSIDISFQAEARYRETLRATVGGEGPERRHALYRGEELIALMHTTWAGPHL